MPSIDQSIDLLRREFDELRQREAELAAVEGYRAMSEDYVSRTRDRLKAQRDQARLAIRQLLEDLVREPPHHLRHREKWLSLRDNGWDYDKSVFIMTKYPQPDGSTISAELQQIIDLIRDGIVARGFTPRLASEDQYYRWLWDNVELGLLYCRRGVALVEDRYAPELNPNVAMEWGWMHGMGRDVLFLQEQDFRHHRANWDGLLRREFDWTNPAPGIDQALDRFLGPAAHTRNA